MKNVSLTGKFAQPPAHRRGRRSKYDAYLVGYDEIEPGNGIVLDFDSEEDAQSFFVGLRQRIYNVGKEQFPGHVLYRVDTDDGWHVVLGREAA